MIKIAYDHQAFASQHVGGITRYFYELAKRIDRTDDFRADIVAPIHFNSYLRVYDMVHERIPGAFRVHDATSRNKRAAVERADHVICISENTRRDLVELLGVPTSKTSVIHLGFTFTASESEESDALQDLGRPFLLYVGHRGHWKNFHRLLTAYASSRVLSKDFALVVFGGGPLSRAELDRIKALGLAEGSVRQISGSDAVLASLYRRAFLFVYPSLYEGFGIPPLEAMGFECPVACSNASSMPEVVGDAARLFDPADIDSIRSAIEDVVGSDDKKEDLVSRGRERVKLFGWHQCVTETAAIYRQIVN